MSVQQCEAVLRAEERRSAREKLLDLRVLGHAINRAFSKETPASVKAFIQELAALATSDSETGSNVTLAVDKGSDDVRSNQLAAAAAFASMGAKQI